ncbi:dihydrolipoyl dehydrogenase [Novosphingobium sp. BW1]|uniref:dihydrolipoyl dehydrogenase n=1 Tax=Novosphingobium sp. BW1 TaxID=2592621 RepID=UPI0011DEAC34|nr:dihydrolipoyl dehydrogenase [Novosphingobium sp. BW1]TYC89697.1 dihydrolipoyl dehydrogenase [Novosphingobium sp. BW1]
MGETLHCDVAVIGAGTAGLAAERAARANGASTLLIDPAFNGTTCATVGCMPSKLLIAAAHRARAVRTAGPFGIEVGDVVIDGPAVLQRVRDERDRFARLTRQSFEDLPPGTAIKARARFTAPGRLALDDGRSVAAERVIIATGSSPLLPPAFAALGDSVRTSDTIFEMRDLPRRLAVVGSGAIGLELAQAFAHLGVETTLFDRAERLGGLRCARVHERLHAIMAADLDLKLGVEVVPYAEEDGARIEWSDGEGNAGEAHYDLVLAALGRSPQLGDLDLNAAGIACDEKGVPFHDRHTMRCGDSAVFLAGDIASDLPLLHEASHDGAIAGRNAAAFPAPVPAQRHVPFSMIFTQPTVATIGAPEDKSAVTGTADFSDQGRARVEGRNAGLLTLYAEAPYGRLIGADMVAPAGEHLAHMLAWAIQEGRTASELLSLPFYHPTIEEGLKSALRTICQATPIDLPQDQDAGTPPGA